MFEGRRDFEWGQTASLLALTANCYRDKKKCPRPFRASDFMPGAKQKNRGMSRDAWCSAVASQGKRLQQVNR